jgi:hypothetical protein
MAALSRGFSFMLLPDDVALMLVADLADRAERPAA